MGSYANLLFGSYEIESSKSELNPDILLFFQEDDLKVEILKKKRGKVVEAKAYFECTLHHILQRLHILGYRKDLMQSYYIEHLEYEIKSLKKSLKTFADTEIQQKIKAEIIKKIKAEIKLLESSTIYDFHEAIKFLIDHNIHIYNKRTYTGNNPFCNYLLEGTNSIFDNYPNGKSLYDILFCLSDIYPDSSKLFYDYSELIDYSYFDISVNQAYENTKSMLNYGHKLGEKIIILTEGSSDVKILRASLELLFPHLVEYYYFMDFHSSNASGSTSSLVNSIKSFIGAGIKNKIIALFDNDTAAKEALSALKYIKIPKTISIQHLPHLDFAESYPTIGPTGLTSMNVNEMACSIEMYLGDNFIKNNSGYIPIHWKGYSSKVGAYQGEIMQKEVIQNNFFAFIKEAKQNRSLISTVDLSNLKIIFKQIFNTFDSIEIVGEY
jgi:hypothetical protein